MNILVCVIQIQICLPRRIAGPQGIGMFHFSGYYETAFQISCINLWPQWQFLRVSVVVWLLPTFGVINFFCFP